MSTANHSQTDRQAAVMNKILEEYLRAYCTYWQIDWPKSSHCGIHELPFSVPCELIESNFQDEGWNPRGDPDHLDGPTGFNVEIVEDSEATLTEVFKYEYHVRRLHDAYNAPNYSINDQVLLDARVFQNQYSKDQP